MECYPCICYISLSKKASQETREGVTDELPKKQVPQPAPAEELTPAEKRLLDERKKINAAIRAERSDKKLKARKLRNRRSVLTGLAIIDWIETHKASPAFADEVQRARDKWLTNSEECALFGLPPRLEIVTPRRKGKAKTQDPAAPGNHADSSGDTAQNPGNEPA